MLVLFGDTRHTILKAIVYRLINFVTNVISGHPTTS